VNEGRVFSNQKVLDRLEALNVLLIQADNTDKLQSINDDLKRYGRANLPCEFGGARPILVLRLL
jgi:thiol:disulfide interchange protein